MTHIGGKTLLFRNELFGKGYACRVLEANEKRFREVERRAADVIEAITHTGLKYGESGEAVDMCQAIQAMRMESERDGELKKARKQLEICMKWDLIPRR